jgi:hypothetical protein
MQSLTAHYANQITICMLRVVVRGQVSQEGKARAKSGSSLRCRVQQRVVGPAVDRHSRHDLSVNVPKCVQKKANNGQTYGRELASLKSKARNELGMVGTCLPVEMIGVIIGAR